MQKESTLTSPSDRTDRKFISELRSNVLEPPLSQEEVVKAVGVLYKGVTWRNIERRYADPTIPLQSYGLISFVPAKGATANEHGVYGFAKLRGNYPSEMEAHAKSVSLIRDVDSYHTIHTCYVGRPFPITNNREYTKEQDFVDIKKDTQEAYSKSVKETREKEQETIREIKEREKKLLEETSPDYKESEVDRYTTLMVKKAQISWSYKETLEKLAEMKQIILKTRVELKELDELDSTLRVNYFEKYKKARLDAGFKESSPEETQNNFMKFLVEDIDL